VAEFLHDICRLVIWLDKYRSFWLDICRVYGFYLIFSLLPEINGEISDVMEGGVEAFKLRYESMDFDPREGKWETEDAA
jgi:hypothetical protein